VSYEIYIYIYNINSVYIDLVYQNHYLTQEFAYKRTKDTVRRKVSIPITFVKVLIIFLQLTLGFKDSDLTCHDLRFESIVPRGRTSDHNYKSLRRSDHSANVSLDWLLYRYCQEFYCRLMAYNHLMTSNRCRMRTLTAWQRVSQNALL